MMETTHFYPILRSPFAGGDYLFGAQVGGWAIRRKGAVICSGTNRPQSMAEGVDRFKAMTSPPASVD